MSQCPIEASEVFGARVLRPFDEFLPGQVIQPDELTKWPEQNRKALEDQGYFKLYPVPPDELLSTGA